MLATILKGKKATDTTIDYTEETPIICIDFFS